MKLFVLQVLTMSCLEHLQKKKKSKSKKSKTLTTQWGKYGLISDTDLYTKDAEFRAWLLEEQKVNPETVSKDQTRRLFSKFVEDFNTGTLPHEKYYHLERYESRMDLLRRGEVRVSARQVDLVLTLSSLRYRLCRQMISGTTLRLTLLRTGRRSRQHSQSPTSRPRTVELKLRSYAVCSASVSRLAR